MSLRDTMSIRQTVRAALAGGGRVVLAVSGGLDSTVLLDAAASAVPTERLIVATFDHGTGQTATAACAAVERLAAARGIRCEARRSAAMLSGEAAFRDARWEFLREVALRHDAVTATAHTLDDQIETVLMRIMRGAGPRGIAGLYAPSPILRPLLRLRRKQLVAYARAQGLSWVEDPSNLTPDFARNRVRHDLLPAMRRARPRIEDELLAIARKASRWRDDVDALIDADLEIRAVPSRAGLDIGSEAMTSLRESDAATIWPAIAARAGATLDRRGIARIAQFTSNARVGASIQLSGGWCVVRSRDAFELRPPNLEQATESCIELSEVTRWGEWRFRRDDTEQSADCPWSAWLPPDVPLTIREWRAGDAMIVRDGGSARKVKRFLSDAGVTGHRRMGWPVVLAGDQIIWIPGVRRGLAATARPGRPGLPFVCEYEHS